GAERETPAVLRGIDAFIVKATASGAIFAADDDRVAAQTIIDYWHNLASRAHTTTGHYVSLASFDPTLAPTLPDAARPYVGLEPFREDTHELYRGRKLLVDDTVRLLQRVPFVAVIGASGSGKSSLALAGVIPALKAGAIEHSAGW